MDKDTIKGAGRELYGRGEEAVGAVTGNMEMRARGAMDQASGKAQSAMGRVGESIRDTADQAMETGRDYFRRSGRMQYRDMERRGMGRSGMGRENWSEGMWGGSPIGFLLITAAAGFAIASMLRARR